MIESNAKVQARHVSRMAYLYVRQSTLRQVFENTESTHRQYALQQRAIALGWPREQIVVIDCDLGRSGASAADREGFQRLVTEVGLGRAGIVMGLEVSRLARNSIDWHRLLEICALADTLILDEDGVYDPAHFNDRLLLGLKGTMSEAELHVLKARLRGGILNKARRGELEMRLPIGFVRDHQGRVRLDPDTRIQDRRASAAAHVPAHGIGLRHGQGLPPAAVEVPPPRLGGAAQGRGPVVGADALGRSVRAAQPVLCRRLHFRTLAPTQAPGRLAQVPASTAGGVDHAHP
jgi:DNA invertase Pin-like site-specific DNA recombinase